MKVTICRANCMRIQTRTSMKLAARNISGWFLRHMQARTRAQTPCCRSDIWTVTSYSIWSIYSMRSLVASIYAHLCLHILKNISLYVEHSFVLSFVPDAQWPGHWCKADWFGYCKIAYLYIRANYYFYYYCYYYSIREKKVLWYS